MRDADCTSFLQWALPQMSMRWPGFRKVRRQVCKRISRRMKALGLNKIEEYQALLERDADEWQILDATCRITISRFYRDKRVFEVLGETILPEIALRAQREAGSVRCWCAGCASGEEVYTLAILWDIVVAPKFRGVDFKLVGTDADPNMVERANRACFSSGSLKEMPQEWLASAFGKSDGDYCVAARHRRNITIRRQDIREEMPDGPFDLILCRNLVLTYFARPLQVQVLQRILARLRLGGFLIIGAHETVPEEVTGLEAVSGCRKILRYEMDPET